MNDFSLPHGNLGTLMKKAITKTQIMRTNPELWEVCKKEAVIKMGKFSARAMQQAVVLYKQQGGGYVGEKSHENALVKWNKKQKTKSSTPDFFNGGD